MGTLMSNPVDAVGMLFNVLIMVALGGLWLLWLRNMKRQKEVEAMLAATSGQLEEATRHLEIALTEIQRLQGHPVRQPSGNAPGAARSGPAQMSAYRQAQATTGESAPQADEAGAAQGVRDEPAAADVPDDVQRIIRLHRMGMTADKIAAQLKLPLARVNLLLRLHQNRPAGQTG